MHVKTTDSSSCHCQQIKNQGTVLNMFLLTEYVIISLKRILITLSLSVLITHFTYTEDKWSRKKMGKYERRDLREANSELEIRQEELLCLECKVLPAQCCKQRKAVGYLVWTSAFPMIM